MWQLLERPWEHGTVAIVDTRERISPTQIMRNPRRRKPNRYYAPHWFRHITPAPRYYAAHWLDNSER